jgi:hypothetical protein
MGADSAANDGRDSASADGKDVAATDGKDVAAIDGTDGATDSTDGSADGKDGAADTVDGGSSDAPVSADLPPDGPAQACSIANPAWAKTWPHDTVAPNNTALLAAGQGLAVAPDGNRWATGKLYASLDLGTGPLPYTSGSTVTSDGFLAKLDPATGLATQSFRFGDKGASDQYGTGIAVAQSGNVGVIGYYSGLVAFTSKGKAVGSVSGIDYLQGSSSDPGAGMWFYLVANGPGSTGSYVTPVKAASVDVGTGAIQAVTANPSKDVFAICGKTHIADPGVGFGGLTANGGTRATDGDGNDIGGMDIIVAVIDATTGNVMWGYQFGGTGDQTCSAIAMDSAGIVYITGTYNGALDFGGGHTLATVDTSGLALPYVAVLAAADGTVTQARTWGTSGNNAVNSIAVDGSSVFIGGAVNSTISFNSVEVKNRGGASLTNAFVVKLATSLDASWGKSFGDDSFNQYVSSLDVSSTGVVVIGGSFDGELQGLGIVAPANQTKHAFVAQLAGTDGSPLCAYEYGGSAMTQYITGVTVARAAQGALADSVVVGGTFQGTVTLGLTTLAWPGTPTCSTSSDCLNVTDYQCLDLVCVSRQLFSTFVARLSP